MLSFGRFQMEIFDFRTQEGSRTGLLLGNKKKSVLSEPAFSVVSKVTCQFNPSPSWWWVCDRIHTPSEWSAKLLLTDDWCNNCWWGCQIRTDRRNHTVWQFLRDTSTLSCLSLISKPFITLSHVCLTSCPCENTLSDTQTAGLFCLIRDSQHVTHV